MKAKLWIIFLLGVLFTGCAQAEDDLTGLPTKVQSESAETDKTVQSESAGENEAVQSESQTAEPTADEESKSDEAYILTFEATTVDGETLDDECLKQSKLTMLNVWATYCGPCLNEMPDLGAIAAAYDVADFQMIGIVSDVVEEDVEGIEYAKELIGETGANYPHLLLNQSLYSNLVGGVDSVPTTFFVNEKGEVLGYVLGAQSKESWEQIINSLLAEME